MKVYDLDKRTIQRGLYRHKYLGTEPADSARLIVTGNACRETLQLTRLVYHQVSLSCLQVPGLRRHLASSTPTYRSRLRYA